MTTTTTTTGALNWTLEGNDTEDVIDLNNDKIIVAVVPPMGMF